jgi:hypothetical protein
VHATRADVSAEGFRAVSRRASRLLWAATMRSTRFAVAALALAACKTESISEVATNEVTANITATTLGDGGTDVNATFRKGAASLTFLQLTSDDSVSATTGSTTQKLTELSLLGVVTYGSHFSADAEGTTFTVALTRKKDDGAPNSTATLPTAFEMTPLTGTYSRADAGPNIEWSNAGTDPMSLRISGPCIDPLTPTLSSGTTSYQVAAGALKKRMQTDGGAVVADDCVATAELSRSRAGTLDTGYANGSISGIQRRSVSFTTAP